MTTTRNEAIAALADALIPPATGELSGSDAGVPGTALDDALRARPDLGPVLDEAVAEMLAGTTPAVVLERWETGSPAAFERLFLLVRGAYFLNENVRTRLHYDGATPHPLGPDIAPDQLDLVVDVVARGARYRTV